MAHTSAFPFLLVDGEKVNGLRVQELKVALVSAEVPESQHAHSKVDKLTNSKMFCQEPLPRRFFFAPFQDALRRPFDSENGRGNG